MADTHGKEAHAVPRAIQFFPPKSGDSMQETLSPMAFNVVAGASTRVPIMVMMGNASRESRKGTGSEFHRSFLHPESRSPRFP